MIFSDFLVNFFYFMCAIYVQNTHVHNGPAPKDCLQNSPSSQIFSLPRHRRPHAGVPYKPGFEGFPRG
jgi:hypothetical protein